MSLLPLALVVAIFMGQPINYQAQVYIDHTTETTLYGVACHEDFREVGGNAQHLCGDLPSNTILLYGKSLGEDVDLWLNVIRHEVEHLRERVFEEAGPYRAGCDYSWVPQCEAWERMYR